jgi:uncharacterized protein (DUF1501 family)
MTTKTFSLRIEPHATTRRGFLATCAGLAGAASLAGQTNDYRALVCVFLFGGNDGGNVVVPMDAAYATYARGRGPVALAQRDLLPITAQSRAFGLHPSLAPLRDLYSQRRMAIAANVGTLVKPLTRAEYLADRSEVPRNLYSHSDQVQQWQSSNPTTASTTGWGGRIADLLAPSAAPLPAGISVAGNNLMLTGQQATSANLSPGNELGLEYIGDSPADVALSAGLQQILALDTGAALVSATQSVLTTGLKNAQQLRATLADAPALTTVFPDTDLGRQLKQVAQIISLRSRLGASRQIFFCSQGGYDNHSDLLPSQAGNLEQLGAALAAFYKATEALGVAGQVTSFTSSEFGRTFNSNSTIGSDHAWGSHHLVIGGGVRGGEMVGTFPNLELQGPDDAGDRGVWIPTSSLDQYGASLAGWFGVAQNDLAAVFPNLKNFSGGPLGLF